MGWIAVFKGVIACAICVTQAMMILIHWIEVKKIEKNKPYNSTERYLMSIELWVFMLFAEIALHDLIS